MLWAWMLVTPWRIVSGLVDAGRHLDRGEKALTDTALRTAQFEVFAGPAAARRARFGLEANSPLLDVARLHPTVDSALGEVDHLVAASKFSADAAKGTLRIAKNALRGPTRDHRHRPGESGGVGDTARAHCRYRRRPSTRSERTSMECRRNSDPSSWPIFPRAVRPDVTDALEKADEAEAVIADAQAGFEILPGVLGGDGPRTYLIGMQNSAEERGTGGALLRFSLLTFNDGKSDIAEDCEPGDTGCSESVYDIDRNRKLLTIPLPEDAWYVQRGRRHATVRELELVSGLAAFGEGDARLRRGRRRAA